MIAARAAELLVEKLTPRDSLAPDAEPPPSDAAPSDESEE